MNSTHNRTSKSSHFPRDGRPDIENTCMKAINAAIEVALGYDSPSGALEVLLNRLGESFLCDMVYLFECTSKERLKLRHMWISPDVPESRNNDRKTKERTDPQIFWNMYELQIGMNQIAVRDVELLQDNDPYAYSSLKQAGIRSFISCKLSFLHENLGFFVICNFAEEYFPGLNGGLDSLRYFIASLINSRKTIEKLEKVGLVDKLTGCGNRHGLYELINGLDAEDSIGVLYGDVNDLKVVNDNEGHDAGDALLVTVAQGLIKVFGPDRVFRMGGDEFIAVGSGVSEKNWSDSISELRSLLAEKNVYIAVGSYWLQKFNVGFDEIVRRVDSRMYEDKRAYYASHNTDVDHTGYIPSYDIMIKIKPANGSYKVVEDTLGIVDRLSLPENFNEFINRRQKQVHPDDRSSYTAFWNLKDMVMRIKRNKGERSISFEYRVKEKGKWQWVEDVVILFERDYEPILVYLIRSIQFRKQQELVTKHKQSGRKLKLNLLHNDDFISKAAQWIDRNHPGKIGVAAIDVNFFKLFNEIYGHAAGSRLLERIGAILSVEARMLHGLAGYMGGDNFCIIFPMDNYSERDVTAEIERVLRHHRFVSGFVPVIGIYISVDNETVSASYDRALIALSSIKGSFTEKVNFYDATKYRRMRDTQAMVMAAQLGFKNGEFTFYLQPHVDLRSQKIVSSEALIRWEHRDVVISPALFMRAMERNGFIYAVDRFIWEQVFIWQCSLIEKGISPLPCSVSVSPVDFFFCDVASFFIGLSKRYRLDPEFIRIKITEKCYSQNPEQFKQVTARLRAYGFRIILNDYENIYVAMKMLRNVDIDILVLSSNLIHEDEARGIFKLGTMVNFAHLLDIRVIAENVEQYEQLKTIEDLNCDYARGFLFYKPMSQSLFEMLLTEPDKIEKELVPSEERLDDLSFNLLMNGDLLSEDVIDSMFEAMAVIEISSDGNVDIIQVNRKFQDITELSARTNLNVCWNDFESDLTLEELIQSLTKADENPGRVHEFRMNYRHPRNGINLVLRNRVFPVNVKSGRYFYLLLLEKL